jgi:hypothetical protein
MPYPGQFHRLVMIGQLYAEQFNMTLSIVPSGLGELGMPAVDQATIDAVAADVQPWFANGNGFGGFGFSSVVKLTTIKLNRIGPDGHYVDNDAMEKDMGLQAGQSASLHIPQAALVVTLGTALERGRGSKGRVYTPSNQHMGISTDGRIPAASATAAATAFKILVDSLNETYTLIGRVGVASNAGAGRFEHVTRLSVGRVVDTMRSRRASLVEDRQEIAV